MKVCVGVISVGNQYLQEFEKLFKPSVVAYCQKYGYDLKIFTDFLDPTRKQSDTISFQKCLVPDKLREYDLVVVLDADIYIESHAPPIHTLELNDKIGIVNEVIQSSPEGYQYMVRSNFADNPVEYYKKAGFDLDTDKILNTGVMLCRPFAHAEFLKYIYEKYVDESIGHPRGFHYEQACIGYELQTHKPYQIISNFWNFIYIHTHMTGQPVQCYFLHFAGLRGNQRETALARHTGKSGIRWGIQK